jgi:gliding motility-associated-like protein
MKNTVTLLIFLCCAFAKAQLESSYWYFGINAGIDFSSGTAIAIDDGQLQTLEGCSTISDEFGNLLFYTDGSTVYNAAHVVMPNGTGLKGNSSSTSSSIIVPLPNNPDRFYIFTVDTDDQNYRDSEGLHYSVVDMSFDGGLGDVDASQKNIPLLSITSEKLTAIENGSGNGFWVITHFEDTFYSYELTATGLNTNPVTTTITPFIELVNVPFTNVDVSAMRGYIKVNPTGDKLVAAHFSNNTTADFNGITNVTEARSLSYAQGGELYLYDFDNNTGILSNPIPLLTKADGASCYGVEFSANGNYLYVETDYMTPSSTSIFNFIRGEIDQYDLNASNIAASKNVIYTDALSPFRGALQLGLDNKIYHSRINRIGLSVIESPDNAGVASNYNLDGFILSTGTSPQYGLPIFVQSFLSDGNIIANDHCFGEEQSMQINSSATINSIIWDFGDPSSSNNTSTLENPNHTFSEPGNYTITATVTTIFSTFTTTTTITVFDNVSIDEQPEDIIVCDEGFDTATFDLTPIINQTSTILSQQVSLHETEEEAILNTNPILNSSTYQNTTNPQTLFVKVSNENCEEIIPFQLIVENCPFQIYNVITPNDDGKNDTFVISGLRNVYDKFKISIFTRYGQKIWEGDNNSPDWDGRANQGLFHGNDVLPTGTYFYVIQPNEPETKPVAGYIYLN